MPKNSAALYNLSTGKPVTSLSPFSSPTDEYCYAFRDRARTFLNYYTFNGSELAVRSLTRGEFWDLACVAANHLSKIGISKGKRVIHCFSVNSVYDLIFRLAAVFIGCVPVTVNWQADNNETIIYKAKITNAKSVVYDEGFAERLDHMKPELPPIPFLEAREVDNCKSSMQLSYAQLRYDDERMVIFTSGTTGRPKGVSLSHRSYLANRLTFEQYFGLSEKTQVDLLLANPLHHANSSALSDWGTRRGGTIIHLIQRYTTDYWKIIVEIAKEKRDLLVAPMVSRHIDFLESLSAQSRLPVKEDALKAALGKTDILIGSAPVGPTTVKNIRKYSNHLPLVRFGSTETCLQVMATPRTISQRNLMMAFEAGWAHRFHGKEAVGYYIGREHFPFTQTRIVKSINPDSSDYFHPCEIGEPGYLITQGPNIMSYYVGEPEVTKSVFQKGWYTGLKDIVYTLDNFGNGKLDYYWMSRDSALLIRGGANYSCDQIAAELNKFVVDHYKLKPNQFQLAVVGIKLGSEHEDSCCVTIELDKDAAHSEPQLKADFIRKAANVVSKGSRPDYIRFGKIPRNFKGTIIYPQLEQDFLESLGKDKQR